MLSNCFFSALFVPVIVAYVFIVFTFNIFVNFAANYFYPFFTVARSSSYVVHSTYAFVSFSFRPRCLLLTKQTNKGKSKAREWEEWNGLNGTFVTIIFWKPQNIHQTFWVKAFASCKHVVVRVRRHEATRVPFLLVFCCLREENDSSFPKALLLSLARSISFFSFRILSYLVVNFRRCFLFLYFL